VHLNCYKIREARRTPIEVFVENQFGEQHLLVKRADTLCAPAEKDMIPTPPTQNTNHFKCYRVRDLGPRFQRRMGVRVQDQFEDKFTTVIKPHSLCAPTDKNGEDPTAPMDPGHLTCFKIRQDPGQPRFTPVPAEVSDQFAIADLTAPRRTDCRRTQLLCVPSIKRIASPGGAFLEMGKSLLD
jgi:hypothetical protein